MGEFFELLEEFVTFLEVDLPELLPLGTFDLVVSILPEPLLQLRLEVVIRGVHLFPISGSSYDPST